jgi:hypothetical protein
MFHRRTCLCCLLPVKGLQQAGDALLCCPVLSCPVLSCPVLSCPVLSCPVLSSKLQDQALLVWRLKQTCPPPLPALHAGHSQPIDRDVLL